MTFVPPATFPNMIGSSFAVTAAGSGNPGVSIDFLWDWGPAQESEGAPGEYAWFQSQPKLPVLISVFSHAEALERDARAVAEGRLSKRRYASSYSSEGDQTNWVGGDGTF